MLFKPFNYRKVYIMEIDFVPEPIVTGQGETVLN